MLEIEERLDEAVQLHEQAAALRPDFLEAHENIEKIHEKRCAVPEAYRRALLLRASYNDRLASPPPNGPVLSCGTASSLAGGEDVPQPR